MKYLKKFNESNTPLTEEELRDLFNVIDLKINPDGIVDVLDSGAVEVSSFSSQQFDPRRLPIKFGYVKGEFIYCGQSLEGRKLTTLEGCPERCGYFYFDDTEITDLTGSPKYVDGFFKITNTPTLKSLRGGPISVGGDYECSSTGITSLEGVPTIINGDLLCSGTKIRDFKGGPEIIRGSLYANNCDLTSLEGLPKEIDQFFLFRSAGIWDPSPLRDVKIGSIFRPYGKIEMLLNFFFSLHGMYESGGLFNTNTLAYQRFQESLDYNWVKGDAEEPKVDLFRLMEALDEFDIDLNYFILRYPKWKNSIGPYQFVDLNGERVDALGNKIS